MDIEIFLKWCGWVVVLLVVLFVCNVVVLFLLFMDLWVGLSSELYLLINFIKMFWDLGFYVLVVLVVGFLVVFFFVKLVVFMSVCMVGWIEVWNEWWLEWVEWFGKWLMFDVFLVCIILFLMLG